MASFCFKNYYTSTNTYAQHAGADLQYNMVYIVVSSKFLKKHLVYILFDNMYIYNILLYIIASLFNHITTSLFYIHNYFIIV
jgi:hypothetical protein